MRAKSSNGSQIDTAAGKRLTERDDFRPRPRHTVARDRTQMVQENTGERGHVERRFKRRRAPEPRDTFLYVSRVVRIESHVMNRSSRLAYGRGGPKIATGLLFSCDRHSSCLK